MAKKDFSKVNTGRVYDTIAAATAEPEQEKHEIAAAQDAPAARKKYKARKEYSAQEKQAFLEEMKTTGKKGVKLPRINVAFAPSVYEYIQTMSRVRGESLTAFVNLALREHMDEHRDIYDRAIEFKNSL